MTYEETWRGKPIDQLDPFEAGVAWRDDLTLDQEQALANHNPYEIEDDY